MNFTLTPLLRLKVLSTVCAMMFLSFSTTEISAQSCPLSCGASTNVSIDGSCTAAITELVLLTDETSCPDAASFVVLITDPYGNSLEDPTVDDITDNVVIADGSTYLDVQLSVTVTALDADGEILNSCWGFITLEDKSGPVPDCPDEPITMPCKSVADFAPVFIDACDGEIPGTLLIEFPKDEICDPSSQAFLDLVAAGLDPEDYSHSVTRIYGAQDSHGNPAQQCTIQILVERLVADDIVDPPNYEYTATVNTALNCDGSWNIDDCFNATFAGDLDPANPSIWALTVDAEGNGTGGSHMLEGGAVDISDAPECISIFGSTEDADGNPNSNTATDFCLTVPCDGFVQFDWSASMVNAGPNARFANDEAEFLVNGIPTLLTDDINAQTASGTEYGVPVVEGDVFCFRVNSMSRNAYTELNVCDIVVSGQYAIVLDTDTNGDGILDSDNGFWDDNGNGDPDPLEVGVPQLCGENLWPLFESECNIGVYYTDQEYPTGDDCKRHILRTWEVREWYCGDELDLGPFYQTIIIKDFENPVVTCDFGSNPDECKDYLTITTNVHSYGANGPSCGATYLPPLPTIEDNCTLVFEEFEIDIQYIQMETGNAGFIDDWDGVSEIELDMGLSEITYYVYDKCHNLGTCTFFIDVVDDTPPAMICDQNTVVSLTTTGTAKVYASTFDDGSHDDCKLKKILVRRMDTTCDCDAPTYPDAVFLGEYEGHLYYHTSYAVDWYKATDLSLSMGGYLVDFDVPGEEMWVDGAVYTGSGGGNLYHHAGVNECIDKLTLLPYVFEIEDPCTFSSSVKFCCDDVETDEIMVVLRAVDAYGNFNECMVNVDVQDKIGPTIICGPDVELECDFPFDLENPDFSHVPGIGATATNHCGDELEPVPSYNIVEGACDNILFIEITWSVTDADGNTTSCIQIIDFDDPALFTEDNIVWPDPLVEIEMCDNPDNIGTDLSGIPTYINITSCNVLAYNFNDVVFFLNNIEPNACFKIKRTWTIIDWCGMNEFTFEQVIKATNDVAPVIDGDCGPEVICTTEGECQANATLSQSATDSDCTLPENLFWTAFIDIDSDGSFDGDPITTTGAFLEFQQVLPIGTHKVKWQVDDRCGNKDVCTQEIEVIACNIPAIYCTSPLLVLPLGESGEVEIWVTDWDCTSELPCGGEPTLSFDENTIVTNVTYSCADIPAGQNSVVIEQTIYSLTIDMDGNIQSNQVIVTAEIQDNGGFCTDDNGGGSTRHAIAGAVQLEDGRVLTDVDIDLEGGGISEITNNDGEYAFPEMDGGSSYIINPDKQDPHAMGVSTLDIIMLQRHILNLESLSSPYKFIAADANDDQKLSAADIVEIRKLILEYYSEYPNNVAWRFVDKDYSFLDSSNPLFESYTEEYQILNLSNDMEINFIAMKIGDLNNSVDISGLTGDDTESRSGELFQLTLGESTTIGEVTEIPVYAEQPVYGTQFALEYTGNILGLKAGSMALTQDHYNLTDNKVSFSYSTENLVSYTLGEPAFYILVETNANFNVNDFEIATEGVNAQAYDANMEVLTPTLMSQGAKEGYALYQNTPNPFIESTQISFNLPEKMNATLLVRDITGKLVFTQTTEYTQGINIVDVDRQQLNTGGIYYYSIEAGNYTATKKMVVLD